MFLMKDSLPNLKNNLRILHAAAGAPNVDVWIDGKPSLQNLSFAEITDYMQFSPGKYEIQIYLAGSSDNPLYSDSIELLPNVTETLCICLLESSISIFRLKDVSTTSDDIKSYLRFIDLSPNSPLLSLSIPNGESIFNGVEYLETTGYYPLSSGIYTFELTATQAPDFRYYINALDLNDGSFHTLFIIGLIDSDKPKLGSLFVKDGI